MLRRVKYNNFTLYSKEGQVDYNKIFEDFMRNRLNKIKIFRNQADTKVILIKHDARLYILKVFKPKGKKVERIFKAIFKRDYFLSFMKMNDVLWEQGMRFQNNAYLLGCRKKRSFVNIYVMLIEYIPGMVLNELQELPEHIKKDVVNNMMLLHKNRLVSGDAHKGNFILSDNGLRIIDLSGKKFTRCRVAEDYITLEKRLKITEFKKDYFYHYVKMKLTLANKIRNAKKHIKFFFTPLKEE